MSLHFIVVVVFFNYKEKFDDDQYGRSPKGVFLGVAETIVC